MKGQTLNQSHRDLYSFFAASVPPFALTSSVGELRILTPRHDHALCSTLLLQHHPRLRVLAESLELSASFDRGKHDSRRNSVVLASLPFTFLKMTFEPGMAAHIYDPSTLRLRQEDCCKSEVSYSKAQTPEKQTNKPNSQTKTTGRGS